MEKFSEKLMEDAIANSPEDFLEEKGLILLARQYRIGSYIFDLLFEDQYKGKLIVEIQKGTLDRTHTYKILDYYHEYKEKNPQDFIDLMVVANTIPPERKRRLKDLGIEYRETPVSMFIGEKFDALGNNNLNVAELVQLSKQNSTNQKMERKRVSTLGDSAFIENTHNEFKKNANKDWAVGGKRGSFNAKHLPTIKVIDDRFNKGWSTQIWLSRPEKGKARCKFEISGEIDQLGKENVIYREKIADFIRSFIIRKGLPKEIEEAKKSTIVATRIDLPKIQEVEDDRKENIDKKQIEKIIEFITFLENTLDDRFLKSIEQYLDENKI